MQLPHVQQLHTILWDHDDLKKDDKIGTATLSLGDLPDGHEVDTWLSVEDDAHAQAVGKGKKGHKRDSVIKVLTAPLQRGGTQGTSVHVKVRRPAVWALLVHVEVRGMVRR